MIAKKDEAAAEADNKDQGMSIMDTEDNETAETAKQAIDRETVIWDSIADGRLNNDRQFV